MDAWTSVSRNPHWLAVCWSSVLASPPLWWDWESYRGECALLLSLQNRRETPGSPGLALVEFSWPQRVSHRSHVRRLEGLEGHSSVCCDFQCQCPTQGWWPQAGLG